MREGNGLLLTRLDRTSRSTPDLLEIASELEEGNLALKVPARNIDTTTLEGGLFFTMIAAFAEFEHALMVARTEDGLAATRPRGRVGGRKPKLVDGQKKTIRKLYDSRKLKVRKIAAMRAVSCPTTNAAPRD
jgi:DNA invertase Pin-like site-specific DNA recombinase